MYVTSQLFIHFIVDIQMYIPRAVTSNHPTLIQDTQLFNKVLTPFPSLHDPHNKPMHINYTQLMNQRHQFSSYSY